MLSKIIIALYVITTSLGLIVLKLGANEGAPIEYVNSRLVFNINLRTVVGIALYGLSFMVYIYLISKYDLGYIIPLLAAFVYVLIFVASAIIFKEVFTVTKIAAIFLILAGIILLNLKGKQ